MRLFEIYFRDRSFWSFDLLRAHFDSAQLLEIAKWYSRGVVVVESLCGFALWALPPRLAAIVGMSVLTGIAVLSNWDLFSVVSCLIGLSTVGLLCRRPESA